MPPWVHLGDGDDDESGNGDADLLREPVAGPVGTVLSFVETAITSPPKWAAGTALAIVHVLISVTYVVSKPALQHLAASSFALLQVVFSLPVLAVLAWVEQQQALRAARYDAAEITSTTAALTFICGMLGGTFTVCFLWQGVALLPQGPAQAAILHAAVPAWVAVISTAFGAERFSWQKAIGVVATSMGAVALFLAGVLGGTSTTELVGTAFLLASTLSVAGARVMLHTSLRKFYQELPCTLALMCSVWACVGLLPIAFRSLMITTFLSVPASAWGAVVFCTLITSIAFPLCNTWAVHHMNQNLVDGLIGIQPFVAVPLVSALASSGATSPFEISGMALVLVGMLTVAVSRHIDEATRSQGHGRAGNADGYGRMDETGEPFELSTTFLEEGVSTSLHESDVNSSPGQGIDHFNTAMCIASSLRSMHSMAAPPLAQQPDSVSL